jgi:hypothetical protein
MKRLLRTSMIGAVWALSLVSVALTVAWLRSYFSGDVVVWNRTFEDSSVSIELCSAFGHLAADFTFYGHLGDIARNNMRQDDRFSWGVSQERLFREKTGRVPSSFLFHSQGQNPTFWWHTTARAPHWFVLVIVAAAPTCWLLRIPRRRRRLRIAGGHCCECDYDLRGIKDQCPECGAAIPRCRA